MSLHLWPLPVAVILVGIAAAAVIFERRRVRTAVADLIHEVNRPLGAIRLGLSLLGRQADCQAETFEALDREVVRAGASLEELACSYGLVERARDRSFCLVGLAHELADSWQPAATVMGKCIEVETLAGRPTVTGCRGEVGQAAANLIANGLEHGRGDIRIGVAVVKGKPVLSVHNDGERDGWPGSHRIPGSDNTAPGFGRRRSPKTDEPRGRGLRIARRYAVRNGGRLLVDNDRGHAVGLELSPADDPV